MRLFNSFSKDVGIDLGTSNTLAYVVGKGIVLNEPSVVALDQVKQEALAVGEEAKRMLGRTPGNVLAIRPLRDGVIADFENAELMLKRFLQQVHGGKNLVAPRIVIGIPSGVSGVERRAVREAAQQAGAREVFLIEEPVAAAIGAGLPIGDPTGSMIIDIGAGTTEVGVLSLYGSVICDSVRVAGNELSDAIVLYMKKVHNLNVGDQTAEDIKIKIGSAYPNNQIDQATLDVRGLHILSGLPRTVTVKGGEIRESLAEPLSVMVEMVEHSLEKLPPELGSDIYERGMMLSGGGAQLKGLDALLREKTGIAVHIAEDPLTCVVKGTGLILENFKEFSRVFSGNSGPN